MKKEKDNKREEKENDQVDLFARDGEESKEKNNGLATPYDMDVTQEKDVEDDVEKKSNKDS